MDVQRILECGITVEDLICELEQMDPKAFVVFTCDYGDFGHTQQALPVKSVAEGEGLLVESSYSQSGMAYVDDASRQGYCDACDKVWNESKCPLCGGVCVDEEGEPIGSHEGPTFVALG